LEKKPIIQKGDKTVNEIQLLRNLEKWGVAPILGLNAMLQTVQPTVLTSIF
jgi:hypothetical protein